VLAIVADPELFRLGSCRKLKQKAMVPVLVWILPFQLPNTVEDFKLKKKAMGFVLDPTLAAGQQYR